MSYVPTPPPETPWPCPDGQAFKYDEAGAVVCLTETAPPDLPDTGANLDGALTWGVTGGLLFIAFGLTLLVMAARARKHAKENKA